MRLWVSVGVGAAVGAGVSVLARRRQRSALLRGSTEDDGVLEVERARAAPSEHPAAAGPSPEGRALIERLGRRGGMTDAQVQFLVFVAANESRFRTNVGRGDPALQPPGLRRFFVDLDESDAARKAYERNAEVFADCGHPSGAYSFGSGGMFAFLPTYPLFHLRKTPLRCAHPYEVFDPVFSMTAAYSFARGLSRHSFFDGTVVELRAGWGALANMKDPSIYERKLPLWREQLEALGVESEWLYAPAPQWPKRDLMALYRSMGGRLARLALRKTR